MAVEIIAEVGECFNGNMQTAHRMIKEAKRTGCDTVKFQILDMSEVATDDPEYDWFAKITFCAEQLQELIRWAEQEDIQILFTPVSVRTAEMMIDAGCKRVKIASSFIGKTDLLEYIKNHFDDIIISTGMASLDQVNDIVNYFGMDKKISILHCISEYPTGPLLEQRGLKALDEEDVHLQMMSILKQLFPAYCIGYSDHTDGILAPVTAVAMGAEIIEKHITLDRKTPIEHFNTGMEYMGTDHVLSIEIDDLEKMVNQIRRVEKIKGDWHWERSKGEQILIEFLTNRYKER